MVVMTIRNGDDIGADLASSTLEDEGNPEPMRYQRGSDLLVIQELAWGLEMPTCRVEGRTPYGGPI